MKIIIETKEIVSFLSDAPSEFPKYTTQLINLASQNAQGTRPAVVGQLSEMIQEFTGRTVEEWRDWYLKEKPDAIQQATERIWKMVENLKDAIEKIDRDMVERWVDDLVIVKTFVGLKFQEAVLKKLHKKHNKRIVLRNRKRKRKELTVLSGALRFPLSLLRMNLKTCLEKRLMSKQSITRRQRKVLHWNLSSGGEMNIRSKSHFFSN